jgi:hypothetical protein
MVLPLPCQLAPVCVRRSSLHFLVLILTGCISGFAVVFAEDIPDVEKQDIPTGEPVSYLCVGILNINCLDAWKNLCPIYDNFVNSAGHT